MTWHLVFIWITRKIPVRRWRTLGWIYVGILLLSGIPVARCPESRIQRMPQWGVLVSLLPDPASDVIARRSAPGANASATSQVKGALEDRGSAVGVFTRTPGRFRYFTASQSNGLVPEAHAVLGRYQ